MHCRITGQNFETLAEEEAFLQKMGLPLPEICPKERLRELMATRNERKLYHRKCDATGEEIISAYHAAVPFPVYKNAIWWGDSWDAREYGRECDFSRPFFEQFAELQNVVPREGTSIFNCENCDYNSHYRNSRNCYLNSLGTGNENVMYCYWCVNNTDIIDCMFTYKSTLCYECSEIDSCYHCIALQESMNCSDCYFSYQLRGCDHCFFCSNLSTKSYYVFNRPCSQEAFAAMEQKILNGSFQSFEMALIEFQKLKAETAHRALHNIHCEKVIGDHMYHSKNCQNCFDGSGNEDCFHVVSLADSKNIFSCYSTGWPGCEMIYRSAVMRGCTDIAFGRYLFYCNALRYCDSCSNSHDCFGCTGLHHREYCILNKQYDKAEYEKLLPKIIEHLQKSGEWGRFFPPQLSTFAYNETSALENLPLAKEVALKLGYRWRDEEEKVYLPQTFQTPDNISAAGNTIIEQIFACEKTGKNYRIIPQELEFYQKMNLPIPRLHPETRHEERIAQRNPKRIWQRHCANCQNPIATTFAPERREIVYCEPCYLQSVS